LGERLLCKQEVDGSIPFTSTTDQNDATHRFVSCRGRRNSCCAGSGPVQRALWQAALAA
jgi:hypothetical protein